MDQFTGDIEKYLSGQMSKSEQEAFMANVSSDPELKEQFDFQSQVVEGIQAYRKYELKSRLVNIPVAGPAGFLQTLGTVKSVGVAVVGTGIVAGGLYLFTPENVENNSIDEKPSAKEIVVPEEEAPAPTDTKEIVVTEEKNDLNSVEEPNSSAATIISDDIKNSEKAEDFVDQPIATSNKESQERLKEEVASEIAAYEPNLLDDWEENEAVPGVANVEKKEIIDNAPSSKSSSVSIERIEDGIHNFHYKYFNNKLYLYGSFGQSPYEIIEISSERGKRLFLFYNQTYFEINSGKKEISRLKAIANGELISRLDAMR
jgi:hypothetical protein